MSSCSEKNPLFKETKLDFLLAFSVKYILSLGRSKTFDMIKGSTVATLNPKSVYPVVPFLYQLLYSVCRHCL